MHHLQVSLIICFIWKRLPRTSKALVSFLAQGATVFGEIDGHSERLLGCFSRSSFRGEDQTPGRFSSRWEDEGEEMGWKNESMKPEPDFFLTPTITSVHDKYISQLPLMLLILGRLNIYYAFRRVGLFSDPQPGENQNQSQVRERLNRNLETQRPSPLTCTLENRTNLRYPTNMHVVTSTVMILEGIFSSYTAFFCCLV